MSDSEAPGSDSGPEESVGPPGSLVFSERNSRVLRGRRKYAALYRQLKEHMAYEMNILTQSMREEGESEDWIKWQIEGIVGFAKDIANEAGNLSRAYGLEYGDFDFPELVDNVFSNEELDPDTPETEFVNLLREQIKISKDTATDIGEDATRIETLWQVALGGPGFRIRYREFQEEVRNVLWQLADEYEEQENIDALENAQKNALCQVRDLTKKFATDAGILYDDLQDDLVNGKIADGNSEAYEDCINFLNDAINSAASDAEEEDLNGDLFKAFWKDILEEGKKAIIKPK